MQLMYCLYRGFLTNCILPVVDLPHIKITIVDVPSSAEIADFNPKNFACWVKFLADDILKYFSYFFLQGKI